MKHVPVAADAASKSYYKYYEQGISGLTSEQEEIVRNSAMDSKEAVLLEDINKLLEPGTAYPASPGYCALPAGGAYVASNIPMPNVTGEMLYWWFAWHGLDPLRYAIWDPEDHFGTQLDEAGKKIVLNPDIPLEQKTWGVTHHVSESVVTGMPPTPIDIFFMNPEKMGVDMEKIGTEGCEFIVIANSLADRKIPAVMMEVAKKIDGVMTYLCRWWFGYAIENGEIKKLIPDGVKIPEDFMKALIGHSLKEFSNLGKILPSVYDEEKDNW